MTVNVSVHYGVDAEVLAWIARTPTVDLRALLAYQARRVAAVERLQIVVDSLRYVVTVGSMTRPHYRNEATIPIPYTGEKVRVIWDGHEERFATEAEATIRADELRSEGKRVLQCSH